MTRERPRSQEIFHRGEKRLIGGVNSPVRAFRSVGGAPMVVAKGEGARVWDADGNVYLDYVCSWGALILGHANPAIASAVADQARKGTSFGITTELEIELAERIAAAMPSIEKIRFVSSGTEATMSAVRLARGFTGRDLFLKFEGCYHGHSDGFLSQAGSGLATLGISASPGVPEAIAALTINVPYNDFTAVEKAFHTHKGKIAAVIVEPVAANMGVVLPAHDFLESLREITLREKALLIFDEVITGFRLAYGGAQAHYRITPDLTTLGKIIGGGLPVAAYGGRREIMERLAPVGDVYQAGTLSGNPMAMRAGIETLKLLQSPKFYEQLDLRAGRLAAALRKELATSGVEGQVQSIGSLMTLFFTSQRIQDYAGAKKSDTARFGAFFRAMLDRGVLLAPSQFEALFVSAAHTDADIEATVLAARESLHAIPSAAHAS
jgi:glutamate-1-semialdehyde 2,1-aminomutase